MVEAKSLKKRIQPTSHLRFSYWLGRGIYWAGFFDSLGFFLSIVLIVFQVHTSDEILVGCVAKRKQRKEITKRLSAEP